MVSLLFAGIKISPFTAGHLMPKFLTQEVIFSADLLFREAAALHVLVVSMGQNEFQTGLDRRGKVTSDHASFDLGVSLGTVLVLTHIREG